MLLSIICLFGHAHGPYLIRTCDNSGEVILLFPLALSNCFNDRGVIGAKIDEDMSDASLRSCQQELVGR